METKFNKIIDKINDETKIKELKEERHHGINRYDHSLRVAKMSYQISNLLKLKNIEDVTVAAMLHDFYFDNQLNKYSKFKKLIIHPIIASQNASDEIKLNNVQRNIIEAHMYPLSKVKPNCKEAICVSIADKLVATYEMIRFKFSNQLGIYVIFLMNILSK